MALSKNLAIFLLLQIFVLDLRIANAVESRGSRVRRAIMEIAVKSQEDLFFYRYGDYHERTRIGKSPAFDIQHVNFGNTAAGKGLYLAENPLGSARFAESGDDEDMDLVTVKVRKGIPILDL